MSDQQNHERDEFEKWAKRTHRRAGTHFNKAHDGTYTDNRIAAKWAAWLARAALARVWPAAPSSWQPIETAPKDGTEVLLYLGAPWSCIVKARWYAPWANWQENEDPIGDAEYCGIGSEVPTHWMPLPSAPKE